MSSPLIDFRSIQGPRLRLEKVRADDLPRLAGILISPTSWFSAVRHVKTPERFVTDFQAKLAQQERGEVLVLQALHQGAPVALSTLHSPDKLYTRFEIGYSWVADIWQRTFVNTEMKYLMLRYAFEELKLTRVEFCVHPTNEKSNRAMRRLGANLDGCLRKWRLNPADPSDDGDRNIYSFLDREWPRTKLHLERLISR